MPAGLPAGAGRGAGCTGACLPGREVPAGILSFFLSVAFLSVVIVRGAETGGREAIEPSFSLVLAGGCFPACCFPVAMLFSGEGCVSGFFRGRTGADNGEAAGLAAGRARGEGGACDEEAGDEGAALGDSVAELSFFFMSAGFLLLFSAKVAMFLSLVICLTPFVCGGGFPFSWRAAATSFFIYPSRQQKCLCFQGPVSDMSHRANIV